MPGANELDPAESLEAYIGNQVREARRAKGWSQTDLAAKVFSNKSRISGVENGEALDHALAIKLGLVLELGDSLTDLVRIREQQTVRHYAKPYLAKQESAALIHTVGFLVPGLLQTPDYARELMLIGQVDNPTNVESYVEQRMERQKLWERDDPPWFAAVLDEAAIAHANAPQLERLREAQEQQNITLQLLPFGAGKIMGTMAVLTQPDGSRGAYTEGFLTGHYSEEPAAVLRFQRVYDRLASSALTAEATTACIEDALKRFK
ncbi:helix-turn-helix domain-containing protein [Streptomyces flavofungini]|uniref:Helix-turn-helix domain-containing protein n=1 Tax=Streptomyces flavofungini TaxID=68200 RepID=A0ABS0X096_9ACTN|nr:Scr1 family TA system antitoxin-like transcriptional regulator [Streptomyces flavofungini]MBJ3806598.1 helix-turn-helix domain-containing protein [Streptomyces flavofungini]GHC61814.1 transcriptional regulator [Streptomyces flavofungini]